MGGGIKLFFQVLLGKTSMCVCVWGGVAGCPIKCQKTKQGLVGVETILVLLEESTSEEMPQGKHQVRKKDTAFQEQLVQRIFK